MKKEKPKQESEVPKEKKKNIFGKIKASIVEVKAKKTRSKMLEKAAEEMSKATKEEPKKKEKPNKKNEHKSMQQLATEREKQQKKAQRKLRNRQLLRKYLDKAGYEDISENKLVKTVFRIIIALCLFLTLIALIVASVGKPGVGTSLVFLSGIWTGVFAGLFVIAWVVLYIFLDLKIFSRTIQVEDVLPDFLQLTSANISAGMPIDRALWFAVRPRFGILAKEIEEVAKSTISGEDLKDSLLKFTHRYDSKILKRSVNLLIEGMESGGELAELLNKIALNIQETRIIRKEMAANVMTYVIFIGFATVVAAPVLFGLAGQLLIIIQQLMSLLAIDPSQGGSTGAFTLTFSADAVSIKDFRIFSVVTLLISALFSAFIISVIRKGSIKEGLRYIPMIVLGTIILYFISSWLLGLLLGGIMDL